jgi:hypothetical protein
MTLDEKIDIILTEFSRIGVSDVFDNIYYRIDPQPRPEGDDRLVKHKMFEEGLLDTKDPNELVCFISPYGQEIQKNGGWLKHRERLDSDNSRILELQQIEEGKLRWDAKLSKLKAKTFWPVFIFGVLGGLSGAISLYFNLTETESAHIENLNYQLYDTRWNQESSTLELFRTNADSAKTITETLERFNAGYQKENYPFARLVKVNFDTAFIAIDNSNYLTQQMGTTGADEYLAKLTFAVSELEGINFVDLNFLEGDHAVPGTYERTDFNPDNL